MGLKNIKKSIYKRTANKINYITYIHLSFSPNSVKNIKKSIYKTTENKTNYITYIQISFSPASVSMCPARKGSGTVNSGRLLMVMVFATALGHAGESRTLPPALSPGWA